MAPVTATTIADIHQQSLSSSPIHLMHLAVAYHSPELLTLDTIIARHSAITSFPTEILLQIRSYLLPSLVQDVHSQGTSALTAFEDAGAERLCGECIEYNEQVFGTSVWEWPNFVEGCDCPRNGERPVRSMADHTRVGDKVPRCRREWLQSHLSSQVLPTRPIWEAVEAMLETVDCNVTQLAACAHEAAETRVCVVPRPEAPCPSAALRRAQMEFGLGGAEVSAPLEQQEAGMIFITPAKTEPLVSPAADNGSGVFGTVGFGLFGFAIALSTVSEKIVSLPRSLLKADKTAAALACAAGFVVAARIGATLA